VEDIALGATGVEASLTEETGVETTLYAEETAVGPATVSPPAVGPSGPGGEMVFLGGVRSLPLFGGP
jgi:hypothetical protein